MQFIADTGFVAGFWDPNDKIRNWVRVLAQKNPGPHLTCEPVLVEACFLAGATRVARVFAEGDYLVDFSWQGYRPEVLELLDRYADRDMDVADACIIMLAEANPGLRILTTDRKDFTIYRTRKGKPLRCEFPPE